MNKKVKMYLGALICLLVVFSFIMLIVLMISRNKFEEERAAYSSEIESCKSKISELEEMLGKSDNEFIEQQKGSAKNENNNG